MGSVDRGFFRILDLVSGFVGRVTINGFYNIGCNN